MTARTLLVLAASLSAGSAHAAEEKPARPEAPADKMICKRQATIGSLVATRKVCMTRAQWNADREQAQSSAQKLQNTGFSENRD